MTDDPVPVFPSPKFQLKVYGDVPPVVEPVNVTGVPVVDAVALIVNDADRAVAVLKMSEMIGALASLLRADRFQLFSMVCRLAYSS